MTKKLPLLFYMLVSIFLTACFSNCQKEENTEIENKNIAKNDTSPEFKVLYADHTGWSYNQNIYEVNIRQFTNEGTFKAFENELPRLADMGVGILWLMPINPIGETNRKGSLGSYYSVKDYTKVNTEFGSMSDFKSLVAAAHANGMYVIVDWVANHTSWDNTLTVTNPEFYVKNSAGNFIPPIGHEDWTDVIQLDYGNNDMQEYMIKTLKDWIVKTGIDGYRFDYVDGVPTTFWKKALAELVELKSDVFFLAEGDGIKYHQMGFDMTYCWGLHGWDVGTMRQIYEGTKTVYDLDNFLNAEKSIYIPDEYRMYFTTNHDENSWHGTAYEQLGEGAEVFAVLTQTLYGMPLVYSGQEAGLNKRLEFFDHDPIDWSDLKYEALYTTMNHLRDTCKALWNGNAGGIPIRVITTEDDKVFAFNRAKDQSNVLVLLNLSSKGTLFQITEEKYYGSYIDIFTMKSEDYNNDTQIRLNAWGYKILVKNN